MSDDYKRRIENFFRNPPLWYRLAYQELMQAERDGADSAAITEALEDLGDYLDAHVEFDPELNGMYEAFEAERVSRA